MRAHGLCVGMWHSERPLQPVPGRRRRKCSSRRVSRGARGRVPRSAQIRVSVPCSLHPENISTAGSGKAASTSAAPPVHDFGCCGRADRRRKPRLANCLPTVVVTPSLFDLAFQINAPPAHNPIFGTRPNHFRCRAQQQGGCEQPDTPSDAASADPCRWSTPSRTRAIAKSVAPLSHPGTAASADLSLRVILTAIKASLAFD